MGSDNRCRLEYNQILEQMELPKNRERDPFETDLGQVRVVDWCDPPFVGSHEMEAGLGSFASYRSLFTSPEGLAKVASGGCADVILALDSEDKIIGYCIMREPEKEDFWGRLGPETLYEIVGLEASRTYRSTKLGKHLLSLGLTNRLIEHRITYMVGYSWTWDLEGTGLTASEYRKLLANMLTPYGFKQYPTNEPNVSLRPENMFMARIGEHIDDELMQRFKNLLFGILM